MRRFYLMICVFMAVSGCATMQKVVDQTDPAAIDTAGQALVEGGAAIGIFNPAVGVWAAAIGAAVIGMANVLKHYKKGAKK